MSVLVNPFYDPSTDAYSYVVANPESRCCAFVDAALGAPEEGMAANTQTVDLMLDWVCAHDFVVRWILETALHADAASARDYLKAHLLCAQTAIGNGDRQLSGYDKLLNDGDTICLDHACGHVLALGENHGVGYQFGNALLVGDALHRADAVPCGMLHKLRQLGGEPRLYTRHPTTLNSRRVSFVTRLPAQPTPKLAGISLSG